MAGSVTTDRSFTSKWKRSDVQKEEMHLDTFFGTQGYKTPLDWAFDSYRGSGTALLLYIQPGLWQDSPCSASEWLASIVVFWWKSQRFRVPCTYRPSSFLMGEGKKKQTEFNLQAPLSHLQNWKKWERFLWACPHCSVCPGSLLDNQRERGRSVGRDQFTV